MFLPPGQHDESQPSLRDRQVTPAAVIRHTKDAFNHVLRWSVVNNSANNQKLTDL